MIQSANLITNIQDTLPPSLPKPSLPKIDEFLQELATIQQHGSKRVAILGSRHVPITHQNLIELMANALAIAGNKIITSGATGTNFAVIRGVLAANPNLLTVILPQGMDRQPPDSREQLENVINLIQHEENNQLSLAEASTLCNQEIIEKCQQLICFAFHDSHTLMQACEAAEAARKVVTIFYFD